MKHLSKSLLLPLLIVGLLMPAQLRAQKPGAVVSISGVDELMGDLKFLAEQAGAPGGDPPKEPPPEDPNSCKPWPSCSRIPYA